MSIRWLVMFVALGLVVTGCEVLAPVVGVRDGGADIAACRPLQGCDAELPEPALALTAADLDPPDVRCDAESTVHLDVDRDTALDLPAGSCTELAVVAGPADGKAVVLTLEDAAVHHVRLTIEAAVPTILRARDATLDHVELGATGEIALEVLGPSVTSSQITLARATGGAVPTLVVASTSFSDVLLDAPGSQVTLRQVVLSRAVTSARTLTLERSTVSAASIAADAIEILGGRLADAHLDVGHLAAVDVMFDQLVVSRCDDVWLSVGAVSRSDIAACTGRVEILRGSMTESRVRGALGGDDVEIVGSVIDGDVLGENLRIRRTVLSGERVIDPAGILDSVALCGTEVVSAGLLICPVCEPVAPPQTCIDAPLRESPGCPGLCETACDGRPNSCEGGGDAGAPLPGR